MFWNLSIEYDNNKDCHRIWEGIRNQQWKRVFLFLKDNKKSTQWEKILNVITGYKEGTLKRKK